MGVQNMCRWHPHSIHQPFLSFPLLTIVSPNQNLLDCHHLIFLPYHSTVWTLSTMNLVCVCVGVFLFGWFFSQQLNSRFWEKVLAVSFPFSLIQYYPSYLSQWQILVWWISVMFCKSFVCVHWTINIKINIWNEQSSKNHQNTSLLHQSYLCWQFFR